MSKATITHVVNGYIVEFTKLDFVNNRPETTVAVFLDFEEVLAFLKEERL